MQQNNYPKLHNATWPGIVGKGPDSEPPISLDDLLNFTANAEVDGVKFDGIDIGLFEPHFNIDESDDGIKRLAEKVSALNLNIGSLVAPIWGGPAMGSKEDRAVFVPRPVRVLEEPVRLVGGVHRKNSGQQGLGVGCAAAPSDDNLPRMPCSQQMQARAHLGHCQRILAQLC